MLQCGERNFVFPADGGRAPWHKARRDVNRLPAHRAMGHIDQTETWETTE
jgi:hypothetical protein